MPNTPILCSSLAGHQVGQDGAATAPIGFGVGVVVEKFTLVAGGFANVLDLTQGQGGVVDIYDSNGGAAVVFLAAGGQTVRAVTASYPTSGAGSYVAGAPAAGQYGLTVVAGQLRVTADAGAAPVTVGRFFKLLHS
jgi:hypothetical protein